jgi:3-methyladenine DNA glycosylase AlkD
MNPTISALVATLEAHANLVQAERMAAYMRNQFSFLGIAKPLLNALSKPAAKLLAAAPFAEVRETVLYLWDKEEREYQYIAMDILHKNKKNWTPDVIELIEELILRRSWWDTVDMLAGTYAGEAFQKWEYLRAPIIAQWRNSDNKWLVRSSIIFQLKYKEKTDAALLFDIAQQHAHSQEFFIQKAIGWALRQHAYFDAPAVRAFVAAHPLAPLSRREALKHIGA